MPTLTAPPTQERRKFLRNEPPPRLTISLLDPQLHADHVNISEGGLCLRLAEHLEVRSLVQLEIVPERAPRSVQCTGRVSWVMQRLDLRATPPFLFDVGIEFVNPPRALRQWLSLPGLSRAPASAKLFAPAAIRGRTFTPRVERGASRSGPWHLVVTVGDVPCFSQHYLSKPAAQRGWATFKRQQGRIGKR